MDISFILKQLEDAKRKTKGGRDYWTARHIQAILGYGSWQNFLHVIERAMAACESSGIDAAHHFIKTVKMITLGKGGERKVEDYFLSRYACYLIAMNGTPDKPEIGAAQTYFALQTRRQEISDSLTYDEKRVLLRERVKNANKHLASAAKKAGVTNFPSFQDSGYIGLYNMGNQAVKRRKHIPENANLLDYAGRVELAANEFRVTQAEEKLRRNNENGPIGQIEASNTHRAVGREVREAMRRSSGTLPEDLPAEEPIQRVEARLRKQLPKPRKK